MYLLLFRCHNLNYKFWPDIILINEKLYNNILVYNISYETLIEAKPMRIRFDKIEGFRVYDGTRYLDIIFGPEKIWCYLQ